MESDKSISVPLDGHNEAIQRIRPLHGRTSGPTRRSTKGQWTAEEDEILRKAVQRFKGKNWKKIAECFKDRTDVQCLHRWQKVLNPELVKGPWSKEEDEMMIELVNRYGPKKWSAIAQHLPGRIGKQCRERWHNHLNPNINKEAWTQQEELALIRAHQVYGNRWAELTKFLPGRTDNAIKNHWNSSVKKKLDSYLASGLLEQFQGLPLVAHQNQPMPSSSSRVQSSGDNSHNTDPRLGLEAEEISECSQGSTVAGCSQSMSGLGNAAFRVREEFQFREDPGVAREQSSSPASCSDHYFASVGDVPFSIPEQVPLEVGCSSNFLPQNFSQNPASHQGGINDPTNSSNPECMLISEDECCQYLFSDELNGETFSSGNVNKEANSVALMESTSNVQLSESIKAAHSFSPSKYGELVNSCSQSFPTGPLEENQMVDHFFAAHEQDTGISAQDGFIYTSCTASSPCDGDLKEPPKLVPVNSFASDTNATHSSPAKEIPTAQLKPEDGGSLCYEPPRFPSLDIPFLSCDLVHSGSDMQQEYSPLGIRQLMMSSMNCLTPFRLWDSPTRDGSPDAVLKSAAKTFAGTPSILKKRSRDLLSPLSDRRIDKKLDLASSLTKEFSKLDVVFGDSEMHNSSVPSPSNMKVDNESSVEDKENLDPSLESGEQNGRISDKDGHSGNSLDDTKQGPANVEQPPAVITEDGANDVLFFSPDQAGFKADRAFAPSSRTPKNLYRIILGTLSEQAAASEMASGNVSSPAKCKHTEDQAVASTSGPCNTVDDNRNDATTDNTHSIFGGTPFKRSTESPSAWKSPWFMNSFIPGPRVDTDITIEDMGYFMSPGDRSYDAIALMKQLSEQNASAYADALDVLGNETPETLLEKRHSSCQIEDQETKNNPDSHKLENDARLASSFLSECRTLDFSECETPGKKGTERTKSATCVSLTSPSSYLLKSCR